MSISENDLLELFYDCESWHRLNSGNNYVDIDELIKKLKENKNKTR